MKNSCPLQAAQIKIRPIEAAHDKELYELIRLILKSYGLDRPGTAYYDPELANLSSYYSQDKAAYFVMVDNMGTVIGGVGVAPFLGTTGELQKLYLHPDYRKLGLGEMLLRRALAFAPKYYTSLYLETHSNLKEAVPLYEKMGFRHLSGPLPGGPHSEMNIWMEKKLIQKN